MANQTVVARRTVAAGAGAGAVTILNPRGLGNILYDEFFEYTITFTFTTGAENFQQVIPIQSDAHFICMSTAYTNDHEIGNNAATTATPYVRIVNGGATVLLTDGGNQHFLSNAPVPVSTIFGSGELPHVWEFTHMFKANTPLAISITGMGAAAPFAGQTIRLIFSGMKVPLAHAAALGLVANA